ncbi:MAG: hypothetical protein HY788_01065 [Deltaproteobacteria bacterium]|nr:hypothetical protein [Deltaproteobacteria bacterium]
MINVKRSLLAGIALILLVSLGSCGGDSTGTPGTEGQWNPVFQQVIPIYCETTDVNEPFFNSEVDAYFDPTPCNPIDPGSPSEPFSNHRLLIRMYNADFPGNPGSAYQVTINRFHIEYRRPFTEGDTAPILETRDVFLTVSLPPVNLDDNPDNWPQPAIVLLDLVDVATRNEYRRQFDSGERIPPDFPTRYSAVVTMYGSSIVSDEISTVVQTDFTIGNVDYCPCTE